MRRQKEVNTSVLGSRARWFESVPERSKAKDPAPLKVISVLLTTSRPPPSKFDGQLVFPLSNGTVRSSHFANVTDETTLRAARLPPSLFRHSGDA
jgi:hypothetical protein